MLRLVSPNETAEWTGTVHCKLALDQLFKREPSSESRGCLRPVWYTTRYTYARAITYKTWEGWGELTAWASSSSNLSNWRLQSSSKGLSRSHTMLFTLAITVLSARPWLEVKHWKYSAIYSFEFKGHSIRWVIIYMYICIWTTRVQKKHMTDSVITFLKGCNT